MNSREARAHPPRDLNAPVVAVRSREKTRKAEPAARAPEDVGFLQRLGERVREARARRGMTRKILAHDSGVSERYLAQLESGQGNSSILVLRQLAQALGLPLADLLRDESERSVELVLTQQFLKRLPPEKLAELRAQLLQDFGAAAADRRKRIALIGLRGAGKSTLGERLAAELGSAFIELDREIEADAGTSLQEVFLLHGQAGYRRYERRALERILARGTACVIATGGSIVSEPATYDLLLSACFTVWLKAAPQEHMERVAAQGDYRPMAGNDEAMEDLRRILSGREALYGQADRTVDTAGRSIEESLGSLRRAVRG
ncbi:MAG: helix-turn-helix transcriptional regulator [Burkholderiales bacterium]|nr:helix-turn-helix transcriptional regulator [Burkholderiales bacterium]